MFGGIFNLHGHTYKKKNKNKKHYVNDSMEYILQVSLSPT